MFRKLISLMLVFVMLFSTPVLASDISPEAAYAAQWTANAVKITFNSNGGGVAPDEQIYTYGIARSLPNACSMVKEGYTFAGWAISNTATTPDWLPGATSTTAFGYADETKAVAKTLYAVWKPDTTTPTIIETLNSITSFLGVLHKSSTPTSASYNNASLVEKVNYLESRLASLESNVNTINSNVNAIKNFSTGIKFTYYTSGSHSGWSDYAFICSGVNGFITISSLTNQNTCGLYLINDGSYLRVTTVGASANLEAHSVTVPADSSKSYYISGTGEYTVYKVS